MRVTKITIICWAIPKREQINNDDMFMHVWEILEKSPWIVVRLAIGYRERERERERERLGIKAKWIYDFLGSGIKAKRIYDFLGSNISER